VRRGAQKRISEEISFELTDDKMRLSTRAWRSELSWTLVKKARIDERAVIPSKRGGLQASSGSAPSISDAADSEENKLRATAGFLIDL